MRTTLARRALAATALLGALAVPSAALAAPSAVTPPGQTCKSVTTNISYLKITKISTKPAKAALGCQEANAVGNTWMLRFKAHMPVQRFTVDFVTYRCSVVPVIPRNMRCIGGGTQVAFAAPTGG